MLEFGYLLFDSSPIFIAKDAPSSNEMSTNLFQKHDSELAPFASRLTPSWSFLNSNSATSRSSKSRQDRVTLSANFSQLSDD
jgi:hypothetical protein